MIVKKTLRCSFCYYLGKTSSYKASLLGRNLLSPRLLPFQGISFILNRLWYQSLYIVSNHWVAINVVWLASRWPIELLGHALGLTKASPCVWCLASARVREILTGRSQTSQLDGQTPGTCWSYKYRGRDSPVQNDSSPGLRMLEPVSYLWGKETLEMKLIEQA